MAKAGESVVKEQAVVVKPLYHEVDGFKLPIGFTGPLLSSAMSYKPHVDDLFVVGYPRSGATWIQQIIMLLKRNGQPPKDMMEIYHDTPFIDMMGSESCANIQRPGAIKSHLPYSMIPKDAQNGKYIVIVRNPKDVVTSYYHMHQFMWCYDYRGMTFDYFVDKFLAGEVGYGDYFDNALSWYEHRKDPNVKYILYEEMKADVVGTIKSIAEFIGPDYAKLLSHDELLQNVLKYSAVEYMYGQWNESMANWFKRPAKAFVDNPDTPSSMREMAAKLDPEKKIWPEELKVEFVRKGQVNDWKNWMTEEQSKKLDEMTQIKLKNAEELLQAWQKCGALN